MQYGFRMISKPNDGIESLKYMKYMKCKKNFDVHNFLRNLKKFRAFLRATSHVPNGQHTTRKIARNMKSVSHAKLLDFKGIFKF